MRYTKENKDLKCRIKDCKAEEWMQSHGLNYAMDLCNDCPFCELINELAMKEDNSNILYTFTINSINNSLTTTLEDDYVATTITENKINYD